MSSKKGEFVDVLVLFLFFLFFFRSVRKGTMALDSLLVLSMILQSLLGSLSMYVLSSFSFPCFDSGYGGSTLLILRDSGKVIIFCDSDACTVMVDRLDRLKNSSSSCASGLGFGFLGFIRYLSSFVFISLNSCDSFASNIGLWGVRGRLCSSLIRLINARKDSSVST